MVKLVAILFITSFIVIYIPPWTDFLFVLYIYGQFACTPLLCA